jgi:hypothetical protein
MNNETDYHDILKALREDPSLDIPTALDNFEVKDEDRRAEITEEIYEARYLDAYLDLMTVPKNYSIVGREHP